MQQVHFAAPCNRFGLESFIRGLWQLKTVIEIFRHGYQQHDDERNHPLDTNADSRCNALVPKLVSVRPCAWC